MFSGGTIFCRILMNYIPKLNYSLKYEQDFNILSIYGVLYFIVAMLNLCFMTDKLDANEEKRRSTLKNLSERKSFASIVRDSITL